MKHKKLVKHQTQMKCILLEKKQDKRMKQKHTSKTFFNSEAERQNKTVVVNETPQGSNTFLNSEAKFEIKHCFVMK